MALDGTYATGSSVNNTNHATFIPKLWSDEILAEYEKSLVMKPLVKSLKMAGKKGDTINIPMPLRGSANQKLTEGGLVVPAVDGSAEDFSDQAFRDAIQILDDNDVPMDSRKLVIPPAARNHIMGIDRYVSSDFVNGRGVVNGKIGELYGVDVFVSTNLPANSSGEKPCLLFHTDALVIAEQMAVRTQTQYKQEYLADLMTADTLYGEDVYREDSGVVIYVAG